MAIAETLWADGAVQDVYYRYGSGTGAKYFRAPFQIWKTINARLGPIQYITTCPAGPRSEALNQLAVADQDELRMWRFNWDFLNPEPFRVGEHEFGDYVGRPDDWIGVHKFSRV